MKFKILSPEEMIEKGKEVGKKIITKKGPVILSLEGELGSGKTTFLQGLAWGLGVKENITSPTFLIFKKYETNKNKFFYHFDAYRIKSEDLPLLNFEEIITSKNNIIAIEWGERVKKALPSSTIKLAFSFISLTRRGLIISDYDSIMKN